jgi:hypothetical protein
MIQFDIEVQRQIVAFGLDDFSPNSMLPNVHGGQYGEAPDEWRRDVASLACCMLAAELIIPLPGIEKYQEKTSEEIMTLLLQGDPESGLDVDLIWDVMHFSGTPKLLELLRVYELNGWEAIHSELLLPLGEALVEMDVVAIGFGGKKENGYTSAS